MNLPTPDSPEPTPSVSPSAERAAQNQPVLLKPIVSARARIAAAPETTANAAGSAPSPSGSTTTFLADPATARDFSTPAVSTATSDGSTSIRRKRSSIVDEIVATLSCASVAAPAIVLSLALLSWSLIVRLPSSPLVVQARPPAPPISEAPTREQVDRLASLVAAATNGVVTQSAELPRLISALEQEARGAGFTVELTTQPPTSPVPGIPELARHSVIFRLSDAGQLGPAFPRFLGWLHAASAQRFRIEPGAVTLQAPGDGLSSATVELGVLSLLTDAKAAAK